MYLSLSNIKYLIRTFVHHSLPISSWDLGRYIITIISKKIYNKILLYITSINYEYSVAFLTHKRHRAGGTKHWIKHAYLTYLQRLHCLSTDWSREPCPQDAATEQSNWRNSTKRILEAIASRNRLPYCTQCSQHHLIIFFVQLL